MSVHSWQETLLNMAFSAHPYLDLDLGLKKINV